MNFHLKVFDYDAAGQLIYIGMSDKPEKSVYENGWYIKKLTYDSSGNVKRIEKAIGIWNDRSSIWA